MAELVGSTEGRVGELRRYGRAVVGVVAVLAFGIAVHSVHGGGQGTAGAARPVGGASPAAATPGAPGATPTGSPSATAGATATATAGATAGDYDPAHFAAQVRTRATQAGIDPQLLMAILYNESYKPHDPAAERAWQQLKPDAAFGIANMHKAAFDDTKAGRDFAGRDWDELPDDPDLAIEAAAWFLHDLAAQLPAHPSTSLTEDELLALGYNAGAGNMLAFARGTSVGPQAGSYLSNLHANWDKAAAALGPRS
ncbi:transglycosylase SLT domain-containing protein [Kitasatospora sp. NBC_01287]|uniref:transglycosylase SLT domain-containing protein n=1 Tax=Kitasatospora sp. NBC_01287 TaxID=2903573 RepID=UPI00224C9EE3|nr:transglycosylase SLT domain-containing protein [Kitasatospora sp. NBC_01287]MCX4751679.1 transglycosylase SLT domain-containing protein [Kitasatospora sp. NBC_01287]